jgi:transposase
MTPSDALPDDIEGLKRLVLAREMELAQAQADLIQSRARETSAEAMIPHLRLAIAKMRRELYGQRSERRAHRLEQMEFELADLVATASEAELAAETDASAGVTPVAAFTRKWPSRPSFPEHLLASGSWCPVRPRARAAGRPGCRSSARM